MSTAIVLHASLRAVPRPLPWEDLLLQALPYARRLQIEGRSGPQRRASLAGIALTLYGAGQLTGRCFAPRELSFPLDQKPVLRGGPEFSLSHSALYVACCVTQAVTCGIDIEDAPPDLDSARVEQLRRWTATEAVLKAAGRGVRDVREVSLDASLHHGTVQGDRFELQPLAGVMGLVGHVATRGGVALSMLAVELEGAELSAALERSCGLVAQVE